MVEEFPKMLNDGTWLVLCKIDNLTQKFIPLVQFEKTKGSKLVWKDSEDRVLKDLALYKGSQKWTSIAEKLNVIVYGGMKVRSGKQCRERWVNFLDPGLKWNDWTVEEDEIILRNHRVLGNKWSTITKLVPGRNESQVKNRWRCIERRLKKTWKSKCLNQGVEKNENRNRELERIDGLVRIDEIVPGDLEDSEDVSELFCDNFFM